MSTAPTSARRLNGVRLVTAARAVAAAALAVVVTFSADHSPMFGLLVFGVFQIVQGAIVALGLRAATRTPAGRGVMIARASVGVLVGAAALALPIEYRTLGLLLLLVTLGYLVLGVLEVYAGLRRADQGPWSHDAVTIGGLTLVVGIMVLVIAPDSVFTVGLIGAWAALTAVYLAIAAVSLRPTASGRTA